MDWKNCTSTWVARKRNSTIIAGLEDCDILNTGRRPTSERYLAWFIKSDRTTSTLAGGVIKPHSIAGILFQFQMGVRTTLYGGRAGRDHATSHGVNLRRPTTPSLLFYCASTTRPGPGSGAASADILTRATTPSAAR